MTIPTARRLAYSEEMIELNDVTIRALLVDDMDSNAYLLTAKRSGCQVLIDAADPFGKHRGERPAPRLMRSRRPD